jgi:gluconate:H+ symporter, GntP family
MSPLLILLLSMALVVLLIIWGRVHAFLALVAGAFLVGLLSPRIPATEAATALATEFGTIAGRIGLVIAFAAVIGEALLKSGAAMAVVQRFADLVGPQRAHYSMWGTGYILSVPVFFDTVFYLLVPLARAMHARTGHRYMVYVMAVCAGGAATHVYVPPTPGPLAAAAALQVDLGLTILVGLSVAIPASLVGLAYAVWLERRWQPAGLPLAGLPKAATGAVATGPEEVLPPFALAILPIALPVVLIGTRTVSGVVAPGTPLAAWASLFGDPTLALFLSTIIALWIWMRYRSLALRDLTTGSDAALASAGVIVLITGAGGAYGSLLTRAGAGETLAALAGDVGLPVLWLAFLLASLIKTAQGSSTVAIITSAGVMQGVYAGGAAGLPHPVYTALACSAGSLVISWMNDSGFWVVSRMGGFTERETFVIWTAVAAIVGIVGFLLLLVLSAILPL